jgi:hypothetical protein
MPGSVSVLRQQASSHHLPSPGLQMVARRSCNLPHLAASLFTEFRHSGLFSASESEVGAGRPLAVPGQPEDEHVWGRPNHLQRRFRQRLSAEDEPLRIVRLCFGGN